MSNCIVSGYQLGRFELNLARKSLLLEGKNIAISERGFLFLCELAKASPNIVSKEYLHQTLWPDRQVSEWALFRIVSDTRLLLEDNGEQQEIINTVRGIGYSLKNCTVIMSTERRATAQTTNKTKIMLPRNTVKIFLSILIFILIILTGVSINNYLANKTLFTAISNIEKYQTYTINAFQVQSKRRDELVKHIEKRLHIKRSRQFEKFFAHYYPKMDKDELFIFSQIRGITTSSLFKNNAGIYKTLEKNRQIYTLIPKSEALAKHLQFWLNKYHSVFLQRQDMGLLYVGVEDGIPYPSEVDQQIKNWLEKHK